MNEPFGSTGTLERWGLLIFGVFLQVIGGSVAWSTGLLVLGFAGC